MLSCGKESMGKERGARGGDLPDGVCIRIAGGAKG